MKFRIKNKEAMYIKGENPTLNQQLKHLSSYLFPFNYFALSVLSFILFLLLKVGIYLVFFVPKSLYLTMRVLQYFCFA